VGPKILESLHAYLQDCKDQRQNQRLVLNQPLKVSPVFGVDELADPIDCIAKDISPTGIGIFLPQWLPASQIYINLPNSQLASYAGLAQVVRKEIRSDGWYEIGASFAVQPKSSK
jgi:hypothetical protein